MHRFARGTFNYSAVSPCTDSREEPNNDEERFDAERNRLGGVLLLKGRDNISSSNEVYADKLKTYANTLYWNETLRADTYKSKLDFSAFQRQHGLDFHSLEQFGPDELDYRHRLLFELSELIWNASGEGEV